VDTELSGELVVVLDPMGADVSLEREVLEARGYRLDRLAEEQSARVDQLRGAVAVLATDAKIDADLLRLTPGCRVAATYGVGYDNIDLAAARAAGVTVTNVPDYCTGEVADHALALILGLHRGIVAGDAMVRDGRWSLEPFHGVRRLRGLRLGLIGFGRIGRAVAERARGFGLELRAVEPYPSDPLPPDVELLALDEALATSDIVSLHVPLTSATRRMIGVGQIALMRSAAMLVNTARGGVLDLPAALAALDSGRLGGLALDVFPTEPVAPDLIGGRRNVIVTPHTAFYSIEAMEQSRRSAAATIADVLDGQEVPNRVA
jgi:D-3-phosphoglycerate dehydrogenase